MRCHQFPLQNGAMHPVAAWSLDGHEIPQSARDHLHTLFYQPLHPTFLPACTWSLSRTQPPSDVLLNVHVGVSKGAGGTQFLVSGDYAFYHYMQQGINDKVTFILDRVLKTMHHRLGLGLCVSVAPDPGFVASLQPLHFGHQHRVPVPTHREIQETLVHIGDKPPRFLGSSDWIGSIEVGFVLDERYGITFRSLSCASGADLPSRAHDLALHFESQGTPVMMGGASMAYTLLGVDIHASTGDVAFLILDPHYTGPDDLVTIQTKGVACGWRKTTSFAPGSFYNFCLPQRPELH
ncbi:hypothetical protein SPRG_07444 [Saprolegnia parasitica CBS 223.65]|uniref:UFSP1/2/DUB catalytic domain-containing protein n=1 Tax=Saprolegnia parasitica (strain CBS 223.65) TaxID=695850 RepID=A0A067CDI0_SAPPC|nr:hypothetical protein SPRG_07444 [Saprolegnia parasitica CBS 223.65]KDO27195.1 hypothetical protein SPRG_07444 [Saprolegnia parasitica CBS 223.65]|eukprot:XP_012201973.1 hypothetical protein SPRG_07444 [Saprolegnia parasitica CBS 223.65]